MKKIMFRADDLGYSKGINYGIYDSVVEGFINNVGVMVNMPDTYHGANLFKNINITIGLHTNFSAGYPLSDKKKVKSLINEKGKFRSSKDYNEALNDFVVLNEALVEIEAQYNKFIELFGRKPDYIDCHAIKSNNFLIALEEFAKDKKVLFSGLPKNSGPNNLSSNDFILINETKIYLTMDSMKDNYEPFKTFLELINDDSHNNDIQMMIFHPGYLDEFIMNNSSLLYPRIKEVEMLTSDKLKHEINKLNIELIEIKDL